MRVSQTQQDQYHLWIKQRSQAACGDENSQTWFNGELNTTRFCAQKKYHEEGEERKKK